MKLSNDQLLKETHALVKEERRLTMAVIKHLQEIYRRKLYLERGYPSLFEMCVKEFGYSNAAAQRRIEAMRLITELPEVEAKITNGEIHLSVAAQVQSFFRQTESLRRQTESLRCQTESLRCQTEAFAKDSLVTPEGTFSKRAEKLELIASLEHKSTREVEKILIAQNPEFKPKADHLRPVSNDRYELKLTLSLELQGKLERIKALLSHKQIKDWEGVIGEMAELTLKKLDLSQEKPQSKKTTKAKHNDSLLEEGVSSAEEGGHTANSSSVAAGEPLPAPEVKPRRSRFIRKSVKREVWKRDRGQCSFTDPATGRKCASRHFLQFDHIHPFSRGGANTADNLRVFCGEHNRARGNA